MTSRRLRNSATIAATPSCGPSSAAIAAYWLNAEVQETELIASRVTGSTSAAGKTPKPSRQPVIAYVFDHPSSRIVRSAIPSKSSTLACASPYRSAQCGETRPTHHARTASGWDNGRHGRGTGVARTGVPAGGDPDQGRARRAYRGHRAGGGRGAGRVPRGDGALAARRGAGQPGWLAGHDRAPQSARPAPPRQGRRAQAGPARGHRPGRLPGRPGGHGRGRPRRRG